MQAVRLKEMKKKKSAWGAKPEPAPEAEAEAEVLNLQTGASKGLPAQAAAHEAHNVARQQAQQAEERKRRKQDPAPVGRVDRDRQRGQPRGPYTSGPNQSMLERHDRGLVDSKGRISMNQAAPSASQLLHLPNPGGDEERLPGPVASWAHAHAGQPHEPRDVSYVSLMSQHEAVQPPPAKFRAFAPNAVPARAIRSTSHLHASPNPKQS
jgi:hypothetical protein